MTESNGPSISQTWNYLMSNPSAMERFYYRIKARERLAGNFVKDVLLSRLEADQPPLEDEFYSLTTGYKMAHKDDPGVNFSIYHTCSAIADVEIRIGYKGELYDGEKSAYDKADKYVRNLIREIRSR